jgi:hypothetical protein
MDPCRVRSESSGNEQRRPSEQSEWFQHKPVAELWARATDRHERRRFKLQGRWRAPTHCSHRAVPSSLEQARKALAKSWEQTSSSWRYALGSARSPVLVNPVLFPCSPVGRGLRVYHAVQDSLLLTVSMPHRTAVGKDRTLYGPAPRIHVALRWNARWHSGGRLIFLFVLFKNIFYN